MAAIIALFAVPSAAAEDSKQPQYAQHTFECLAWLLTDPAAHAANCTPGRPFAFPVVDGLPPDWIGLVSTGAWTDSCTESGTECTEEPCTGTNCEEPPCDPETETCEEPPPCNPETETCEEPPCTGTEEECTPI